ncbi:MAG: 7-carboxy-7-deazaguanine synthase QueE [Cyanobacteria bacterium J06627_28]
MTAPTTSSTNASLQTLPVVETFHSVQGEGHWSGRSAFFIRLAGCDVGCPWCDTKHSWPVASHGRREISALVSEAVAARPFMVVITGGEPLMQDLSELTAALHHAGLRVHLETSGSHPLTGQFDWISLSPKLFKPPLDEIYARVNELKVVIDQPSDFDWAESERQKVPPSTVLLLQPQWTSELGQQHVFDYVLSHPEWRIGLQTHKYLGVR